MPANGKSAVFSSSALHSAGTFSEPGNTLVFSQVITLNNLYLSCRFTM